MHRIRRRRLDHQARQTILERARDNNAPRARFNRPADVLRNDIGNGHEIGVKDFYIALFSRGDEADQVLDLYAGILELVVFDFVGRHRGHRAREVAGLQFNRHLLDVAQSLQRERTNGSDDQENRRHYGGESRRNAHGFLPLEYRGYIVAKLSILH